MQAFRFASIASWIVISSIVVGCSNTNLPKYSVLQSLRVLDLILDSPEVNYDGSSFSPSTVTVTPVVSDLYGSGRALAYNLYLCLDPGVGLGATPTCTGSATLLTLASGQSVGLSASFLSPNYTGSLASIAINLASYSAAANSIANTALSATYLAQSAATLYNGVALLIFYELYPVATPSQKVTSFKRLVLSNATKTTKNTNPTSLAIGVNGIEINSLPTTTTSLSAVMTNSAESYSIYNADGGVSSAVESIQISWFLTGPTSVSCSQDSTCNPDGILNLAFTTPLQSNSFQPPSVATPTTRGRVLIAIGKDNRGGAIVKRYCDGICP